MTNHYAVWAIRYEYQTRCGWDEAIVAVSAESEYGAIKRLCGNRPVIVKQVELIAGQRPQYAQRRIEGFVNYEFQTDETWEHT